MFACSRGFIMIWKEGKSLDYFHPKIILSFYSIIDLNLDLGFPKSQF